MINSGSTSTSQTGGWTNFTQDPCATASKPTVYPYVNGMCGGGVNPGMVFFGGAMGTTGGMEQVVFDALIDCWKLSFGIDPKDPANKNVFPDKPWTLRLPVIACPGNNVGPCSEVVGAVEVDVVWITRTGDKNSFDPVPKRMRFQEEPAQYWECTPGFTNQQCWDEFVKKFGLKDAFDGTWATLEDKTIYFRPSCKGTEIGGKTGGENFGILAKIPVLVN